MRTIDIHAHIVPGKIAELRNGGDWHGFTFTEDSGQPFLHRDSRRYGLHPKVLWSPEQRLAEMDSLGVDIHVLSTWTGIYNYDLPLEVCAATSRDANDYVAELVKQWPQRFAGLATLPMQNVEAAIAELERSMTQLGLKGAQINDHVNGRTYDEPEFAPFWQAVEDLGAVILFHQASDETVVDFLSKNYHLGNTIGNLADRTVTYAALVFGGIMDRHPNLKLCLSHGGGYTCFGAGRLDRGWQVRSEARVHLEQPPSRYLNRFYYDCLTHDENALRYIIDEAGADRVVLGSDWPYDMGFDSPVEWVNGLTKLTQDEKELILWKNLEEVLGI